MLQLIDALDRSVEPQHHTRIISDALHAAGIIDLPQDRAAFRDFVQAVESVLGGGLEPTRG